MTTTLIRAKTNRVMKEKEKRSKNQLKVTVIVMSQRTCFSRSDFLECQGGRSQRSPLAQSN